MKNKFLILSLAVASIAVSATAQTKKQYVSEKFGDNIFISVTGGISVVNSGESEGKFGTPAPHITLSVGKWFNPVWGVRGQGGLWKANFDTQWSRGIISNGEYLPSDADYHKNVGQLRLDGMFNFSNAIWGYNPDRLFNLSVFAGPGLTIAKGQTAHVITENNGTWSKTLAPGASNKARAYVNGSVGLLGKFNVNDYLDIDIEARGELAASYLGYLASSRTVGGIYVGAGLSYTFGGKNFVSCSNVDEDALNAEINRYREELAKANADLEAAKKALANAKSNQEVKEIIKNVPVAGPVAVFFKIGKSKIDDYGLVNLKLVAKVMKQNPDKKYKIAGYADKATGSVALNKKLADARAKAVCDALIKEGVSESQLEPVGYGGTENMFGKNFLNRVVILE